MKHTIVTRFKYDDFSKLKKQAILTNRTLVAALKNQSNKNFTWILIINPDYEKYLRKNIDHDFICFTDFEKYFDYIKKNNIQIQSSIDSDDIVSDWYVKIIQEQADENKDEECVIIHFQVVRYHLNNNTITRRSKQYNRRTISMFYSVYQKKPIYSVFVATHDQISKQIAEGTVKEPETS